MPVNMVIPRLMVMFILVTNCAYGQLSATYYQTSCPLALVTIRVLVARAILLDPRMGASLLRLHFHDCFVGGCDASVLLDDTTTLKGEKTAVPNDNSLRGFEVVDTIKTAVDLICGARSVVSCADILAIAARDSVFILGGPSWIVPLGRRDSTTAFYDAANTDLPSPDKSLAELTSAFSAKGLNLQDMIALSGGHTFGKARCFTFKDHIWNDTNIDSNFATGLKANCPRTGGDNTLANFDQATPLRFDNAYYTNLLSQKGLLHSDQELFNNGSADATVRAYSTNSLTFYRDFAAAMLKMGNISPLTGTNGQVRVNCRKVN